MVGLELYLRKSLLSPNAVKKQGIDSLDVRLKPIKKGQHSTFSIITFFSVTNLTEIETIKIVNTNDKEIALEWKPIVPVEMARHLKYEIVYRKFLEKFK